MLAPASERELAGFLADHAARGQPLRIAGGGTRVQRGGIDAPVLSTTALSGVVDYQPGEMTLIVRPGTPLPEIHAMLAAEGQSLAFEPADMAGLTGGNGVSTIGGVVASNASGPRRLSVGACRDHLLGVRFVDGQGRILKNGGRVMKNVTGLDLSKLMAGSMGTLGVITQMALKTLPLAPARETLVFSGLDDAGAGALFSAALATPFEVSGAAFHDGTAWLRVEGLERQVPYRRDRLLAHLARPAEVLDGPATQALWRDLRDGVHLALHDAPLWRILVKPTDAPGVTSRLRALGGDTAMDWGGGLIWYRGPGTAAAVRALAPHATLIARADRTGPAFPPLTGPLAALQAGLRQRFDPAGILNPGLMEG